MTSLFRTSAGGNTRTSFIPSREFDSLSSADILVLTMVFDSDSLSWMISSPNSRRPITSVMDIGYRQMDEILHTDYVASQQETIATLLLNRATLRTCRLSFLSRIRTYVLTYHWVSRETDTGWLSRTICIYPPNQSAQRRTSGQSYRSEAGEARGSFLPPLVTRRTARHSSSPFSVSSRSTV